MRRVFLHIFSVESSFTGHSYDARMSVIWLGQGGCRMRYFNTEGLCDPQIHYMVNLDKRLRAIRERYVEGGSYFVINRGRQYGKTTTLHMLEEYLKNDYFVISLDFQAISTADYQYEYAFTRAFMRMFNETLEEWEAFAAEVQEIIRAFQAVQEKYSLGEMFALLSRVCKAASRPIVMMIDEVDSAPNNQVFIDFLAQLRLYYLRRKKKPIFQSVILAGVYDIKNLKQKIRPEGEHPYNSPWNIAANFDLDMSFSAEQIAGMLREYEADHHTGMDIEMISEKLYQYTSGYPYLVSLICKTIGEVLPVKRNTEKSFWWTEEGIAEAINRILKTQMPLFDSMTKQLDIYPDMRKMLQDIIYQGKRIPFSPDIKSISMGLMFGFLKDQGGQVAVSNRIFEMRILNMFITEESVNSSAFQHGENNKPAFVSEAGLNMDLVLQKFVEYFTDIYGDNDEKFVETYGRKFFLLYLKPIINGTGNYYLEAQTRDASRTDVIVDYLGKQFVVEMKIWRGNEYNERGERQLAEYLDYYHLDKGYLLSFNFNKKKEAGVKEFKIRNKVIVEAVV